MLAQYLLHEKRVRLQPANGEGLQFSFPLGGESQALLVEEIETVIQGGGRDAGGFADAPEGHLIHEHGKHFAVLVRLLLVAGGLAHREGLAAGFAAEPGGAVRGFSEAVVMTRRSDRDSVVFAVLGGAGSGFLGDQISTQAPDFFRDALVALHGKVFTAGVAAEDGEAFAGGNDGVGLVSVMGSLTARSGLRCRDPEVGAAGVLAEVDLNPGYGERNAGPGFLVGWSLGCRGGSYRRFLFWHESAPKAREAGTVNQTSRTFNTFS